MAEVRVVDDSARGVIACAVRASDMLRLWKVQRKGIVC